MKSINKIRNIPKGGASFGIIATVFFLLIAKIPLNAQDSKIKKSNLIFGGVSVIEPLRAGSMSYERLMDGDAIGWFQRK